MSTYNTGTVTVSSGLTTVSGYGTSWLAEIESGDLFVKRGDSIPYTIAGVSSNTLLTLQSAWPTATVSGSLYDIFRDFTVNANLSKLYGADRSDWPAIMGSNFDIQDNWALGWNKVSFTCTFASTSTFSCAGDKTSLFTSGMRLKITHAGGTTYHNVVLSAYSVNTTVTIDGSILVSPISSIYHSIVSPGNSVSYMPMQNLLPNSRFGVFSCYNDVSTGSAISVDSHTIDSNTVICYTSGTLNLATGKQVRFTSGNGSLRVCPHTITGLTEDVSFQFNLEGTTVASGGTTATAYEATIGDPGTVVYGPDRWTKTQTLPIERILTSDIPTPVPGSMYGIKVTKASTNEEYLWYPVFGYTLLGVDFVGVHQFAGRTVVLGAWVYPTAASGVRLFIQEDTGIYYSSFGTLNTLTWLEISRTIPSSSSLSLLNFGFAFAGAVSDVHYVATPMLSYGTNLGKGNYAPIPNEIVHCVAHISPTHYTGATIAASRLFRIHDETHGQVPKDAAGIYAAFEGTCATANNVLAWWRNELVDPLTHGHILNAQVGGARSFSPVAPIQIKRASNEVYQFIYVESVGWTLVSMDIVGVWY